MNAYSIALFLHIIGVLGFSVALGLEWTALSQIRSAIVSEQVRPWMGVLKGLRRVGFASMASTVITGIYMMLTVWGGAGWVIVSLAAIVLMIALSAKLTGPRMAALGQALATAKGPFSETFYSLAAHPLLWFSIQTRIALTVGIVFLKVAKPDLAGSLLAIGAAIVLGFASTWRMPQRQQAREGSAH